MRNDIVKNFPKTRVCVIDILPFIQSGITEALNFAKQHNIKITSKDGKNLILVFCIKHVKNNFSKIVSPYQKVTCISNKKTSHKFESFIENYFAKVLKQHSIPYCGKYDLTSPDVGVAARSYLDETITAGKQFSKFLETLNL